MIAQLGYLGIGVADLQPWRTFATEILGLEVSEPSTADSLFLRLDEYHHRIVLHATGEDDIVYAGWMVPTPQALRQFRDRLRSLGIAFRTATSAELEQRKVIDLIVFEDPDGLRLEVFHGLQGARSPFQPTRPISGFKAGELGVGHVVLTTRNIEQTTQFYQNVLGLKISDYIDHVFGDAAARLVFFHANARHHSAAFAQLPRRRRLAHLMLELKSLDDVCATYYLCQDKGVPIASTLGRHSNDRMLSFYMVTPSGFELEYGFGGLLVDDATWVIQQYKTTSLWGHKRAPTRA